MNFKAIILQLGSVDKEIYNVKVVKFGGSSLADAEQFKKVGSIIKSDPSRRFVVPSAPGKRFSGDTKVTDMLYSCYNAAQNGGDFDSVFAIVKDRFDSIIAGLGLSLDLSAEYEHIKWAILLTLRQRTVSYPRR